MPNKQVYYDKIRTAGHRLTNNRKVMIQILENQHLTFKEIQKELKKHGYHNVASVYNNLDFLIKENIIVELYIGNKKYYDLAIDNPGHSNESHIHISIKNTNEIFEINDGDIFDYITNHKALSNLDVANIKIVISAEYKE